MLRYEDTAQVGDTIRAEDFEPLPGRPICYVEGVILEKGFTDEGYKAYTIRCTAEEPHREASEYSRVGDLVYVPFQMSMDWDGRVRKV